MKPVISRTYDHNPAHYRFARTLPRSMHPRPREPEYRPGDYAVGVALIVAALVILSVLVGG
jgi:hypothetical protein